MHPGQLAVTLGTVRELVDAQFPWWRRLAIKPVDSQGTVNAIFRVGDQFAARLPLEPDAPGLARQHLESEARAEVRREQRERSRERAHRPISIAALAPRL